MCSLIIALYIFVMKSSDFTMYEYNGTDKSTNCVIPSLGLCYNFCLVIFI